MVILKFHIIFVFFEKDFIFFSQTLVPGAPPV
jgi:hypothetical protein